MNKIAAIVVTYNRKDCLINCLEAIRQQTLPPDIIYIIDNHSTIDTAEMLLTNQIISVLPDMNIPDDVITSQINSLNESNHTILVKYVYKAENTGSAGGFYTGMKTAYDDGYEWFWMMDDDGSPAEDGLEQLFMGAKKYSLDYANALVVCIEDRFSLAFALGGKTTIDDYKDVDIVYNEAHPFNGTFINRKIPEKIGFIKKEMFIWGDENEYLFRIMKNDFSICTIIKSIHYHPKGKGNDVNIFPFISRYQVTIKPEKFSSIYYRNKAYNIYMYNSKIKLCEIFLKYMLYFIFRLKFSECIIFIKSFINGCKNKFN
jgi:GT2 family glycosyltransferase